MRQHRQNYILMYLVLDLLAAAIAWTTLYYFRKFAIEHDAISFSAPVHDNNFWVGLLLIPQVWLLLHYFSGTYTDVFRKSRLQETLKTLFISLLGSVIIFFAFLLDDIISGYKDYYYTFFTLFVAQLFFTVLFRVLYLNYVKKLLRQRKIGFNTLFIGTPIKIAEVTKSLSGHKDFGFVFKGAIYTEENGTTISEFPDLGDLSALDVILKKENIEEVILAVDTAQHQLLASLLNDLGDREVYIKIVPDMYDILSRTVKMNHVVGEAFIEITPVLIEEWQRVSKQWFDILVSAFALLITSPLLLIVAILIKKESKGGVFYKQERLGQYGKPFMIYKFRSMYADAEVKGAQLTANNDPRITKVGRVIRKYRIDELPQFFNVIKGDMSIVGPRAERKFFAEQLEKLEPNYPHIFKVKPGITSLGMVKYGYASTVEEMLPRLKYDLIYIENMSILMDFKILTYTISTIINGRGK